MGRMALVPFFRERASRTVLNLNVATLDYLGPLCANIVETPA